MNKTLKIRKGRTYIKEKTTQMILAIILIDTRKEKERNTCAHKYTHI